jgi:DNA-binding LacI/PurR family transcriptional regulator
VGIDNRRAGHLISQHLMRQGCRQLAFIAHRHAAPTVDARIAGFRDAHDEAGVSCLPEQILRTDLSDQERLSQFLRQANPDGVVCANDFTAARVMRVLQETAPEVLSRVRIAGIDDVKYASLLPVPLTTVRQPCAEIGAAAVTTMFQRLQAPAMPARDVLLNFQLVVRESCRPRAK